MKYILFILATIFLSSCSYQFHYENHNHYYNQCDCEPTDFVNFNFIHEGVEIHFTGYCEDYQLFKKTSQLPTSYSITTDRSNNSKTISYHE
jgi:hypothetical protein